MANSYAVGSVDRKGRFPIGGQIGHSYTVEKMPFRSQLFRSSNPIRICRRKKKKSTFSAECADRIARSKFFLSQPFLSPPHKTHDHTLQQLRCWLDCYCCCCCFCCCCCCCYCCSQITRRGASCSPPASSAYRHPYVELRVVDDLFATLLLLLLCSRFVDSRSPTP